MPKNDHHDSIIRLASISEVHDRELVFVRKLRDGDNDEPSLAVWQERILHRLDELEESESNKKEWKKLVLTTIVTTILAVIVTYWVTKGLS